MAYLEVRKKGKLIQRRYVEDRTARKRCRVRIGSLGKVYLRQGQTNSLGEYELKLIGESPEKRDASQDTLIEQILPTFSRVKESLSEQSKASPPIYSEHDFPDIEGYAITNWLGEGGMGIVWKATQLSTNREVALKVLNSISKKSRERFQREVSVAAKLNHPNIVSVYDSGLLQDQYYFAMELIHGMRLDDYVKHYQLSQKQIVSLMIKICNAVTVAHLQAIVHRDLKPSNILITVDGEPHILDFGLAKAQQNEEDEFSISIDGQIAGTLTYMSPEQAAGDTKSIDKRTDIYSLGVILYRLLIGRLPRSMSGNRYDILKRIVEGDIISPRVAKPLLSRGLETILLKALKHKPQERYESVEELCKDLRRYLDGTLLNIHEISWDSFLRKHQGKIIRAACYIGVVGLVAYLARMPLHAELKKANQEIRAIKKNMTGNLRQTRPNNTSTFSPNSQLPPTSKITVPRIPNITVPRTPNITVPPTPNIYKPPQIPKFSPPNLPDPKALQQIEDTQRLIESLKNLPDPEDLQKIKEMNESLKNTRRRR